MKFHSALFGVACGFALAGAANAQSANGDLVKRGDYLVNGILTCGNCHTPKGPQGDIMDKAFSGGLSWDEPPFKVTAPNITMWIDKLEARGLVQRQPSPTDRRAQLLQATPEGEALARQATQRILEAERAALTTLSAAERAMLVELLHKVACARADVAA